MPTLNVVFIVLLVAWSSVSGQILDPTKRALTHYRAGLSFLFAEAWDQAAEQFSRAIELDPDLALAQYGLGRAHLGSKRYQEAVRALAACRDSFRTRRTHQLAGQVETNQRRQDYIMQLGDAIRERQRLPPTVTNQRQLRQLEMELADMERLVRSGRSMSADLQVPAFVSLSLGSAYLRSGSLADAEREYLAAVRASPKLGEAHNNLAVVYLQMARYDDAEQHVKLAEKAGFRVHPALKEEIKNAKLMAKGR
jgi:tetratricopeptide (TPR) repeat protein